MSAASAKTVMSTLRSFSKACGPPTVCRFPTYSTTSSHYHTSSVLTAAVDTRSGSLMPVYSHILVILMDDAVVLYGEGI
jgi:hypothetical protein